MKVYNCRNVAQNRKHTGNVSTSDHEHLCRFQIKTLCGCAAGKRPQSRWKLRYRNAREKNEEESECSVVTAANKRHGAARAILL